MGVVLLVVVVVVVVVVVTGENKVNSLSDLDWTIELGLEFDNINLKPFSMFTCQQSQLHHIFHHQ